MYPIGHKGRFLSTNWCLVKGRAAKDANRELATTIHELGHVFGAIDHYYTAKNETTTHHSTKTMNDNVNTVGHDAYIPADYLLNAPNEPYKDDCLYGANRSTVSDYALCYGCRTKIQIHLDQLQS